MTSRDERQDAILGQFLSIPLVFTVYFTRSNKQMVSNCDALRHKFLLGSYRRYFGIHCGQETKEQASSKVSIA